MRCSVVTAILLFAAGGVSDVAAAQGAPSNAAGKALSPRAARHDGLYGARYRISVGPTAGKEVLLPEMVKRGGLEIARFEITRAQYAAWDTGYHYPAGTGNYPASGITFPQAQGYAVWLGNITGLVWRVPEEDEVAALYESSEGENTLDYWTSGKAGGAKRPALRPVGSFRPHSAPGEDELFDLGGNVTEWVAEKSGRGKTMGGSADQPANPKLRLAEVDPDFTGFRVVRGERRR